MQNALFYAVSISILLFGTLTVTTSHLFHAALCLLGALSGTAMLFFVLGAETVALAQILVYIGGIFIFVLYAIFLTTDMGSRMPAASRAQKFLGFTAALILFAVVAGKLGAVGAQAAKAVKPLRFGAPGGENPAVAFASLQAVGERLLHPGAKGFLIPFELISILLLMALVGCIAIVRGLDEDEGQA